MNSVDILAVRHVKQGIETERFRAAQPLVQITFIAAGLGLRFTIILGTRGTSSIAVFIPGLIMPNARSFHGAKNQG